MNDVGDMEERERKREQKRERNRELRRGAGDPGGPGETRRRRKRARSRPMAVSARFLGGMMTMATMLVAIYLAATEAPLERRFVTDADSASGVVEERFLQNRDIDLGPFTIGRAPRPMMTVSYSTPSGVKSLTAEVAKDFYDSKRAGRRVRVEYIHGEDGMVRVAGSAPRTPLHSFMLLMGLGGCGLILFLFGPAFWKGRYV